MIRVVAIVWTAFLSVLTAAGAVSMMVMPAPSVRIGMGLLICAVLMGVICVGLIAQGIQRRGPIASSAALVSSSGAAILHHTSAAGHRRTGGPSGDGKPKQPPPTKTSRTTGNRTRAEIRAAESLLDTDQ